MKATEKKSEQQDQATVQNSSVDESTIAHGLAFSLVFLIQEVLDEIIYPWLEATAGKAVYIAIAGVVSLVLYFLVFETIKVLYHLIYTKFDEYPNIEGHWYQVHIPHHFDESKGEDYSHTKISIGETTVCRDWADFAFKGQNCRCTVSDGEIVTLGDETPTTWHTKTTMISGEKNNPVITEVYQANTTNPQDHAVDICPYCKTVFDKPLSLPEVKGGKRFGIHIIDTISSGYMEGDYSDCYPSHKRGKIYFYRTEEERDARVRQYFAIAEKLRAQNGDGQQ